MSSTTGTIFSVTTFGESHGGGVGVVVDGCPPLLELSAEEIQHDLNRRRPGQSQLTTQRQEADEVEVLSGVFEGITLGSPIAMLVRNKDAKSQDYEEIREVFRPSHADYTTQAKYGIRNWQGGGRASARETIGRVAGGAVARKLLKTYSDVEVLGWVSQIHDIVLPSGSASDATSQGGASGATSSNAVWNFTREQVESSPTRCPDPEVAEKMQSAVLSARESGDSLGGVVTCVARNVPAGLGEPVFDKLEADLAKGMLSLPAAKGFAVGSGFEGVLLKGSQHNDPFTVSDGTPRTTTNNSGGVQGGITNGEDIVIRVAFKPTSTIGVAQETINQQGESVSMEAKGRHDPCVVPRAVAPVEAMMCLTVADHLLRQQAVGLLKDNTLKNNTLKGNI